jgi:hypothetical protein
MHLTAVLGNGVSQAVGGKGIGGILNTALSNSKGELVVPVLVTGNMAHPIVTPKFTTGKGIGGILGGILGGSSSRIQATPKLSNSSSPPRIR